MSENVVTVTHRDLTVYKNSFINLDEAINTAKSLALGAGIVEVAVEDRDWVCENGARVTIKVI